MKGKHILDNATNVRCLKDGETCVMLHKRKTEQENSPKNSFKYSQKIIQFIATCQTVRGNEL